MDQTKLILAVGGLVAECRDSGMTEEQIAVPLLQSAIALAVAEDLTLGEVLLHTEATYEKIAQKLKKLGVRRAEQN